MQIRLHILIGFAIFLASCAQRTPMSTPIPEGSLSYLALGDSYTIGQSVAEAERWPLQLAAALRQRGIQIADPEILARTGWTTADLLRTIEMRAEMGEYDLVTLLIGVNDQFQGLSIEGYRERFRELLQIAIKAAHNRPDRVIVLSIPDWSFTPFAESLERSEVSEDIDAFNTVAQEECEAARVSYFDITTMTRPRVIDANLISDDGLHPSATMYAMWVAKLVPAVSDLLN